MCYHNYAYRRGCKLRIRDANSSLTHPVHCTECTRVKYLEKGPVKSQCQKFVVRRIASVCYIWSYWPLRDAQKNLQFNFSVKAFSHQHVFIFLSATTFPILSNISQTQLILQVFLTKT